MTEHTTLSIAIVSGKGGVGKTNIALNLAYALHRAKQRVLLMDCDLGLANLDVLLGIAPTVSVEQAMREEASLADATVSVESGGFSLLPASTGIGTFEGATPPIRLEFLEQLNALAARYDYFIMDVGAGITDIVQHFASRAAVRLVVTTPEPTALTDAYALIKVLATRHGITEFHLLVNQTASVKEEKIAFSRIAAACKKFLDITVTPFGGIRTDPAVTQAVCRQEPLLKFSPSSPAGKDLVAAAVRMHTLRGAMQHAPGGPLQIVEYTHAGPSTL